MTLDALFDDIGARQQRRYQQRKKYKDANFDFRAALKSERQFAIQLRKIAKHIMDIIARLWDNTIESTLKIKTAMSQYSSMLEDWAKAVSRRMQVEVAARSLKQWEKFTNEIGESLQREVRYAPTGEILRKALAQQVHLIKSLPLEAAKRVHDLTMNGLTTGERYEAVRDMVMRTGLVTKARATLIARTETARTASLLTQARAEYVGSTHYFWRTVGDGRVRPSHKRLDGTVQAWASPPLCDEPDHFAHPGQIFNCRCFAIPIMPQD